MAKRRLAVVLAILCSISTHWPLVGDVRADEPTCAAGSTIAFDGGSTVCGVAANRPGVLAYKGIAYATAKRWQAPHSAPWPPAGALKAVEFGPICPQDDAPEPAAEDCLYLNVWAPQNAINGGRSLPVLLFIHGGAFVRGHGSSPLYDGSAFAARGAVVVTFNYRLGALGFLSANALGSGEIGGNFGLMDQQAAMAWVQRNIASFGGDPKRVTLFGESAGAMSVGLHTFDMPSSGPLFAAAIMQSNPLGIQYLTAAGGGPARSDLPQGPMRRRQCRSSRRPMSRRPRLGGKGDGPRHPQGPNRCDRAPSALDRACRPAPVGADRAHPRHSVAAVGAGRRWQACRRRALCGLRARGEAVQTHCFRRQRR